jgi:methylated-DNA-[protein]-cysteine S-methyltransferase
MLYTTVDSPIGELLLAGDGRALHRLSMHVSPGLRWQRDPAAFADATQQLEEYFAGARRTFELELGLEGTAFELRVWSALQQIPCGETISYGELARRVARPDAARAVGVANARNPIAVIVPCHRVIGADGSLTGYGGGLERKRRLLDLEAGVLPLLSSAATPAA